MRRTLCLLLLALLPCLAAAQPISPADAREARKVIEAQLDAFQRDDAERAFSYAAPALREKFGTPEKFMEMVRSTYAVVYRPHGVVFKAPVRVGPDLVQPIRMNDEEGRPWLVLYQMERADDGAWRINGCQLGRLAGQET